MEVPLELTYPHVEKTDALENLIRKKVKSLEKVCGYVSSCRIAVEKAQHVHAGNPYRFRIDMTVPPGHELVVTRNTGEGDTSELPQIIRKGFEAAKRQLKKLVAGSAGRLKVIRHKIPLDLLLNFSRKKGMDFFEGLMGGKFIFMNIASCRIIFPVWK